jgi:hypothetical protein
MAIPIKMKMAISGLLGAGEARLKLPSAKLLRSPVIVGSSVPFLSVRGSPAARLVLTTGAAKGSGAVPGDVKKSLHFLQSFVPSRSSVPHFTQYMSPLDHQAY